MKSFRLIFPIILLSILGLVVNFAYQIPGKKSNKTDILQHTTTLNTIQYASGKGGSPLFIDNILDDPHFTKSVVFKKNIDPFYDTIQDTSIQKYVSRFQPLQNIHYIPTPLVSLSKEVFTQGSDFKLRKEASIELESMGREFTNIFKKKLVIVSAYRSYTYQENLKKKGCPDTLCAPAGHSEHQLGLAVDLFAATTAGQFLSKKDFQEYYKRLANNAHRYGRHNTYQKGIEIDSYQVEPRHRRYLGRELATELFNNRQTFAEWMEKKQGPTTVSM